MASCSARSSAKVEPGFEEECLRWVALAPEAARVYRQILVHVISLVRSDGDIDLRLRDAWRGRQFASDVARPHLLCTAIHADAMRDPSGPLSAIATDARVDVSAESVRMALGPGRSELWRDLARRSVQANETVRGIAWRLPVSELARAGEGPFALVDLGCSAGLNLVADRLVLRWTSSGEVLELHDAAIVGRLGLDREPLDPARDEDANWARACLLPGATRRRAVLDEALIAARAARNAGELQVEQLEMAIVASRLDAVMVTHTSAIVIAYHSALVPFLDPVARRDFENAMRTWTARHGKRAVWASFELDAPGGSRVCLRVMDGASGAFFKVANAEWDSHDIVLEREALRSWLESRARCVDVRPPFTNGAS